jgi:hypothetical protein
MYEEDLPELPEPADDTEDDTATLVLFRFKQENIPLGDGDVYPLADAMAYCQRDDTSGEGWFVGWRHA